MTTLDLMRELRLLGQADIPKDSLERVWLRVLRETAQAVEADNPSVSPSGVAAQGRARACPAAHSFHAPAFGPGKTLSGLRLVSLPDTAPASVSPAGVGGPSGVRE